jgi:hypothetical protein
MTKNEERSKEQYDVDEICRLLENSDPGITYCLEFDQKGKIIRVTKE